jgi:hypothetical protein
MYANVRSWYNHFENNSPLDIWIEFPQTFSLCSLLFVPPTIVHRIILSFEEKRTGWKNYENLTL